MTSEITSNDSRRDTQPKNGKTATIVTWVLAVLAFLSLCWSYKATSRQLELTEKSLELQWRPLLRVQHVDSALVGFSYRLGDSDETDTVRAKLDSIPVSILITLMYQFNSFFFDFWIDWFHLHFPSVMCHYFAREIKH